jgi:predicted RNA-binding Zn ribbon-like protein
MGRPAEHLALSFANTRSSTAADRIADLEQFRAWANVWPGLRPLAARLPRRGLSQLQTQRDATQAILHALSTGNAASREAVDRATGPALRLVPFRVEPSSAGARIISARPIESLECLLAQATVEFLLTVDLAALRRCDGPECRKVFLAHRPDRKWCNSVVCGNRVRVARHARRGRSQL